MKHRSKFMVTDKANSLIPAIFISLVIACLLPLDAPGQLEDQLSGDVVVLGRPAANSSMFVAIPMWKSSSGHFLQSESGVSQLDEVWGSLFPAITLVVAPEVAVLVDPAFSSVFLKGPPLLDSLSVFKKMTRTLTLLAPTARIEPQIGLGRFGVTRIASNMIVQTPAMGLALRDGRPISEKEWLEFSKCCAERIVGDDTPNEGFDPDHFLATRFTQQIVWRMTNDPKHLLPAINGDHLLSSVASLGRKTGPGDLAHAICNMMVAPSGVAGVFLGSRSEFVPPKNPNNKQQGKAPK